MIVDLWQELGFNNILYGHTRKISDIINEIITNLQSSLNAQCRWPINVKNIQSSCVLSYGLPDLFYFNPGANGQCQKLCQVLQMHISHHEPRLQKVIVELDDREKTSGFELNFRIHGLLKIAIEIYDVQLDSILNLNKMKFSLKQGLS